MKNNLAVIALLLIVAVMTFLYCGMKRQYETLATQSNRDKGKVLALSEENNKIYTQLVTAKAQNEALVADLERQKNEHRQTVANHKNEVAKLSTQVSNLRSQLANATNDEEIRAELARLDAELAQREKDLRLEVEKSQALQLQMNELTSMNALLAEKSAAAQKITATIGYELGKIDGLTAYFEGSKDGVNIEALTNASISNLERHIADLGALSAAFSDPVKYPWANIFQQEAAELNKKVSDRKQSVAALMERYNTVYMLVDNAENLVKRGILMRLADGGYQVLSEQCEAQKTLFTPVNRQSGTLSLALPRSGNFALHPAPIAGSYSLNKAQSEPNKKTITIHDSDRFWQGKYLVVRTE
jgi:hypothetical protein